MDPLLPRPQRKSDWVLTQTAFHKLLEWIDGGVDSGGEQYLQLHRRLVHYFDRKNCAHPYELADETLTRVARRLEEEHTIISEDPARYCYIVARFVFLESLRAPQLANSNLELLSASSSNQYMTEEPRWNCLEGCLQKLDPDELGLIVAYYKGELRTKIESRKSLAKSLGISMNALSIRACRIRERLERCVLKCLNQKV